jgi:hypothetical protein
LCSALPAAGVALKQLQDKHRMPRKSYSRYDAALWDELIMIAQHKVPTASRKNNID